MDIIIRSSVGVGSTDLSSFDDALIRCGIGNYNIIRLSSVIPPNSKITVEEIPSFDKDIQRDNVVSGGTWGDRLYVVYASCIANKPGQKAYSAVGWIQNPIDGRGLFVEHHAESRDTVEGLVNDSLNDLLRARDMAPHAINMVIAEAECTDSPKCAFVTAVYQDDPWRND